MYSVKSSFEGQNENGNLKWGTLSEALLTLAKENRWHVFYYI